MDFLHRNANNQSSQKDGAAAIGVGGNVFKNAAGGEPGWLRIIFVVLLFSVTILAVAIALLLYFGKSNASRFVDKGKVQAVFLTNGQVYFGKIKGIDPQYIDLRGIYYLNTQQQASDENQANKQATTNFSLVKLGCELHGPTDQMLINRDQVTFWENLKSDGKVAKAIEQWIAENPDGQKCTTTTDSTQQSTGGNNTTQNPANNEDNKQQ